MTRDSSSNRKSDDNSYDSASTIIRCLYQPKGKGGSTVKTKSQNRTEQKQTFTGKLVETNNRKCSK